MALWPPAICVCWMHIWCIKAHQKYITAACCIQGICILSVDCTISLSLLLCQVYIESYVYGLVREGRGSIADALELRLSCTSPSVCFNIRTEDVHSTGNQPFCHYIMFVWPLPLEWKTYTNAQYVTVVSPPEQIHAYMEKPQPHIRAVEWLCMYEILPWSIILPLIVNSMDNKKTV